MPVELLPTDLSGHQRVCRKSIICQYSTCLFTIVKHCAHTDNCPSMGYRVATELKAWTGMTNKGSLHAIQDAAWLVWHAKKTNPKNTYWYGKEWSSIMRILQQWENKLSFLISVCAFVCQVPLTDPTTLQFLWPWTVIGQLSLCFIEKEKNTMWEHATTYDPPHSFHSLTWV